MLFSCTFVLKAINEWGVSNMNQLFRNRIGIPAEETITFQHLPNVLLKTAKAIPFENLRIIENKTRSITKENVIDKMLVKQEGGLCYELNALLYFFFVENGFNAELVRGVVYNNDKKEWLTLGSTHVAVLLRHDEQTYLVDTGFGSNLPLKPVPLNGEVITSSNGEFRIKQSDNDHGNYVLELKLAHKDKDWRIGYTFDSKRPVKNVADFNEIQTILIEDDASPFNKNSLVTKFTDDGTITLTDTSLTQWINGKYSKEKIDHKQFNDLAKQHFGLAGMK